ncbi:MAG: sulfatase-like hydrolase/transferase, partial [Actinomycetota bacterium]
LWAVLGLASCSLSRTDERPPNVILILADDLGYADIGCFGPRRIRTPHLDSLALEGTRFTDFYVAQAVCTASRAALLTGCYPNRVGLQGALNHTSTTGIHENEVLLSELFKARGYATAVYGKWHLGSQAKFWPLRHGFDEFFGLPYSNDNGPLHPVVRDIPALPLIEGEQVVERDPDQAQFTKRFTDRAVDFIHRNRSRPFFLYLPHVMPHVPIFSSPAFRGRSEVGLYGDVIEELDWGVGQVLEAVARQGLESRTLVIFLSDNGPFLSYGNHAGSARPLREGKLTTWDGGVRVPCLMRWPGRIPAGRTCAEPLMSIDLYPTLASLVGASLPNVGIDGMNIGPVLAGEPGAKSRQEAYFFFAGEELQAVRSGDWKLHLPHEYLSPAEPPGRDGKPANFGGLKPDSIQQSGIRGIASRHGYEVRQTGLALYNLREDVGETHNVVDQHPDLVKRLQALVERMRADLGDSLAGRKGTGLRPAGKL